MAKPVLRIIKGGRTTKRPPLVINGRVIKPLLFVHPGGKKPKAS